MILSHFTIQLHRKYKDAHVLNEFHDISLEGEGEEERREYVDLPEGGGSGYVVENRMAQLDSDEEVDRGEGVIRQSGRLVFSEMDSEDEDHTDGGGEGEGQSDDQQLRGQPERQRTLSSGSEKVGRFEVSPTGNGLLRFE